MCELYNSITINPRNFAAYNYSLLEIACTSMSCQKATMTLNFYFPSNSRYLHPLANVLYPSALSNDPKFPMFLTTPESKVKAIHEHHGVE